MTNTEIIQAIKAEIERLKGIGGIVPLDNREQKTGYESALIDIETFIDTLESEKPMNPEAAMKELDEKIALVKRRGTWDGVDVDEYMDEVRGRAPEKPINQEDELNEEIKKFIDEYGYERGADKLLIAIVARNFVEWQKEQMMKEAVEGVVCYGSKGAYIETDFLGEYDTDVYGNSGDKVRIVIVKE